MMITTTTMRFGINPPSYDRYMVKTEKTRRFTQLHKKLKHQSKVFRKMYEIEQSLEQKEKEANEHCNIFDSTCDDECIALFEEIEHLEHKLKNLQKKLK